MERICNGDCNHNIPNNECAKMAYLMDDFTHVEGCSIAKLLVKYELE